MMSTLVTRLFVLNLLGTIVVTSSAWKLPDISFLEAFAEMTQREGISIFMPEKSLDQPNVAEIIRHFK